MISSGLSRGSSTTSLLLISPGPANETNFLRESPAHLPPLDLAWTLSYTRRTLFLVYCSNTVKLTSKRHQISSVSCSLQIRHTSSCRHYLTEFCYRSECLITRVWCGSMFFLFSSSFILLLLLLLLFCLFVSLVCFFLFVFLVVVVFVLFWGGGGGSISSPVIGVGRKGYGGRVPQERHEV